MNDVAPKLGDIPQHSEFRVPTLSSNLTSSTVPATSSPSANGHSNNQSVKDSVYTNSQAAMSSIANNATLQNVKDAVSNGPIAENVKDQHAKTTSEFRNLADSRTTPNASTATGQPLTHYHSFFYNLLSWENPRATSISFISTVLFIFAARYLPALRWSFKALYITLGAAATAELAGKLTVGRGLASSFRPRKYYTIPRESLEASLEDVEQLINFFVIEFQRVLFAENLVNTAAAFISALVSYWLIKFLPFWGLSLIGVSTIYLGPLIYKSNKRIIDAQLQHVGNVVNAQTSQIKDLAAHHTARATETVKGYAEDYSAKAHGMMQNARGRSSSPEVSKSSTSVPSSAPIKTTTNVQPVAPVKPSTSVPLTTNVGNPPSYQSSDFPHAPRQEPLPGVTSHEEQFEKSQFGGQAIPSGI